MIFHPLFWLYNENHVIVARFKKALPIRRKQKIYEKIQKSIPFGEQTWVCSFFRFLNLSMLDITFRSWYNERTEMYKQVHVYPQFL